MQGMRFTYSVHLHGTLAANARGEMKMPCDASLVAVSTSNSAASNAFLEVGTSADRDGIIDDTNIGNSGTATLIEPAGFSGVLASAGNPYHLDKGTIFTWDLDFDGSSGTAAANVSLVFIFTEG
jgi:hypothetical protein